MEYIEYKLIGGLLLLIIGMIVAVKVELAKRPSFKEADDRYKDTKSCTAVHKSVDEKLKCLPDIKDRTTRIETKIDIFLEKKKNG